MGNIHVISSQDHMARPEDEERRIHLQEIAWQLAFEAKAINKSTTRARRRQARQHLPPSRSRRPAE